jgi:hypothetical protein
VNSYVFGFLTISATTLLAVLGMLYVRDRVSVVVLRNYHEVAGYLLSVIGTLYAVLLGFVVVDAMGHVQDLRVLVDQEASGCANIFLCSNSLPEPQRTKIRTLCTEYAEAVVNEEWQTMKTGKYSPHAFRIVWSLWKEIVDYKPTGQFDSNVHQQLLNEICNMTQNRRTRIVSAKHGVAPILWVVLLVGGTFTVLFTYFFGVENVNAQIVMTVLVSLTLSLNVFLVFIFGSPFSGDLSVQPDSFKLDLLIFKYFDAGVPPPAT